MGYLKVSRELLNSSFWRSLAPAEKGILIDLMAMAAYKPTTYNLYGTEIELEKYELCFSMAKMAERFGVSAPVLKRLVNKIAVNNVIAKNKRKVRLADRPTDRPSKYPSGKSQFYTSLTFYRWALAADESEPDSEQNSQQSVQPSLQPIVQHNKEVINKEVLNESTRRNSACAVPVSNGSKDKVHRKPWYTMEQIAKMELPYAEEIMKEWTEYSGRRKNDVLALLQKFTKNQRHFGLPEMTLDVFNKEFRKEMKTVFALKSKYKNEPVQEVRYLGEDD